MAINIARYLHNEEIFWGLVDNDSVHPIDVPCTTTEALLTATDTGRLNSLAQDHALPLDDVSVLSPITSNQQFVCQGANYRQHMLESGVDPDVKTFNMIFTKASSCICPADSPVIRPPHVRLLDYEIELGLVLGQGITGPIDAKSRATDFIAGLVIVNDYSARDVQIPQMQFYKGKSYRTFGPVGPWLCLLEPGDHDYLNRLELTLSVDGEVRQRDSTANLVYKPDETLKELSGIQDFRPGDLIATGTPAGCALRVPPPRIQRLMGILPEATKWRLFLKAQGKRRQYLQPGQVVEATIRSTDGRIDLGRQRNEVTQA